MAAKDRAPAMIELALTGTYLGTPHDVATQVLEYNRRYGNRVHVVLRCNYPGMDAAAVTNQVRLWGSAAAIARLRTN